MTYVITANSKADSVYTRLKDMMINYHFRPGAQLYSAEIADILKTSITPVREALTRLSGEGMVDTVMNKGFFARKLTVRDMGERYKLASLILCDSIESARHVAEDSVAIFGRPEDHEGVQARGWAAESPSATAAWIESLFAGVVGLSDNKIMSREIEAFNCQTHYVRTIDLESIDVRIDMARDMSGLLMSLLRDDRAQATANLKRQFSAASARMNRLVKEGNARALMSADDR